MDIRPSIEELRSLDTNEYTVAPVACEILSDFITPIEALRILKNADQHAYMLESAQANENSIASIRIQAAPLRMFVPPEK